MDQEKQEEGVKSQFVSSIADARERIKTSRKILGQEHAEVRCLSAQCAVHVQADSTLRLSNDFASLFHLPMVFAGCCIWV